MCRCQPRARYTAAVNPARQSATAADHRAYFAASLLFIISVNQNLVGLYSQAAIAKELSRLFPRWPPAGAEGSRYSPLLRCRGSCFSPDTWPHRPGAAILLWSENPRDTPQRP